MAKTEMASKLQTLSRVERAFRNNKTFRLEDVWRTQTGIRMEHLPDNGFTKFYRHIKTKNISLGLVDRDANITLGLRTADLTRLSVRSIVPEAITHYALLVEHFRLSGLSYNPDEELEKVINEAYDSLK